MFQQCCAGVTASLHGPSSYRTPFRYPRWTGSGAEPPLTHHPSLVLHVILERSEGSPGQPTLPPVVPGKPGTHGGRADGRGHPLTHHPSLVLHVILERSEGSPGKPTFPAIVPPTPFRYPPLPRRAGETRYPRWTGGGARLSTHPVLTAPPTPTLPSVVPGKPGTHGGRATGRSYTQRILTHTHSPLRRAGETRYPRWTGSGARPSPHPNHRRPRPRSGTQERCAAIPQPILTHHPSNHSIPGYPATYSIRGFPRPPYPVVPVVPDLPPPSSPTPIGDPGAGRGYTQHHCTQARHPRPIHANSTPNLPSRPTNLSLRPLDWSSRHSNLSSRAKPRDPNRSSHN